jgi:hypothetical protein
MNLKHKDIFFPKSWFKKNCSSPTPGSYSFKCWLNTTLNNLPKYDNGCSAINAGLSEGSLFLNSLGQISTALCNGQCDFTQGITFTFSDGEELTIGLNLNYIGEDEFGKPIFRVQIGDGYFFVEWNNDLQVFEFGDFFGERSVQMASLTTDLYGVWVGVSDEDSRTGTVICGKLVPEYCVARGEEEASIFAGFWDGEVVGTPFAVTDDAYFFFIWDESEGKWLLGDTYLEGGSRTEIPTGTFEVSDGEETYTITISEGLCDVG